MKDTGERYMPSLHNFQDPFQTRIHMEHYHRYLAALSLVSKKRVLDVASGEGYGSAMLAESAHRVIGVDIDTEIVKYSAQRHNQKENIHFTVGSSLALPFKDNSFEIITSFETIEHVVNPSQMLHEIQRVLRPDGLFIISSPNPLIYSQRKNYKNPFHVKEYSYEEFNLLLHECFQEVEFYNQRVAVLSVIAPTIGTKDQLFRLHKHPERNEKLWSYPYDPMYFIALCSNEKRSNKINITSIYGENGDSYYETLEGRSESLLEITKKQIDNQIAIIRSNVPSPFRRIKTKLISIRSNISDRLFKSDFASFLNRPKISICIPVFNGSKYLTQSIQSALIQTYSNYEIVIVDDSSTDNSLNIAKEFSKRNNRIRVYSNKRNLGLVGNWNRCIELSKGEWIKFLFQDDWFENNCLEKLIEAGEKTNIPFIACKRKYEFDSSISLEVREYYSSLPQLDELFPGKLKISPEELIRHLVLNSRTNMIGEPTAILLKRTLFDLYGYFNISLNQIPDWEYWCRIIIHTGVVFIPQTLIHFRVHLESESMKNLENPFIKEYIDPLILFYEFLAKSPLFSLREERNLIDGPNYKEMMISVYRRALKKAKKDANGTDNPNKKPLQYLNRVSAIFPEIDGRPRYYKLHRLKGYLYDKLRRIKKFILT